MNKYDFKDYYFFNFCFTTSSRNIIIEDESFKEEENNSNYVRKFDIAIISLNAVSCGIMIFLGSMFLKPDFKANNCFEKNFFFRLETHTLECIGNSDLIDDNNRLTQ